MAFLSAIRMKGFKTFARPTELLFEQGVSVIIGPNGSGKSNIADAVLWALGEQSPTSIRGRTMQDVIFSGSDGQRSAAVAEVTLLFDNSSGVFPLEYGEIEIARRVTRDGASEYRINGAASRLLDVQDLAAAVGLGREMHSVISQGKVDELVNSTPATRRALVEDAAGLGRYKKRRDRSLAKLEKTQANLERVKDVEREVRSALRPLKQQVSAAERYAHASEEVARLRAEVALLDLLTIRAQIDVQQASLDAQQLRRSEAELALTRLREERITEEERFAAALLERETLSAGYHQASADVERLRSRLSLLRDKSARLESDLARTRRRRDMAQIEVRSARERFAVAAEGPARGAERLRVVLAAADTLASMIDEARPALGEMDARHEALKDVVFELESERGRVQQEREFLERESDERSRRAEDLAQRARTAADRLAEVLRVREERADEVRAAEVAVSEAMSSEASSREAAAGHRSVLEQAEAAVRGLAEELASADSRTRVLEDVVTRREGAPQAALDLLASEEGAMLVHEALTVKRGYERAVAVALGPLASAVVLGGVLHAAHVVDADGPLEVVWTGGPRPADGWDATAHPAEATDAITPTGAPGALAPTEAAVRPGAPEAPGDDLWEVLDGPPGLVRALQSLVPPTRVVADEDAPVPAWPGVVVTTGGCVWHSSHHGARRVETSAEALMAARGELERLRVERISLTTEHEKAGMVAAEAVESLRVLVAAGDRASVDLREARARRDSLVDEMTLWGRREEEARTEAAEAEERVRRDGEAATALAGGLRETGERSVEIANRLESARTDLREVRGATEHLRGRVSLLEGKRSQAGILTVRLRERERARQEEADRARQTLAQATSALEAAEARESDLVRYAPVLADLQTVVAGLIECCTSELDVLSERLALSRAATDDFGDALKDQGRRESDLQRSGSELNEEMVRLRVAVARLEERAGERERELEELSRRHLSPREVTAESVAGLSAEDTAAALERAERRRERIGPVNPLAEQEYRQTEERAGFLAEQRTDLESSMSELRSVIRDLDEHIETTFTEVFEATRGHFEDMVQVLFPGGKGMLRLVEPDPDDAGATPDDDEAAADDEPGGSGGRAAAGIVLEIKPPRKAPRSMSLLSGGEKALAAIAFLFGLFLARPCPFYVLDEVEAALDDLNLGRFLSLVRRYQERTQFIVITHQRRTMEIADRLYGVAMDSDGTSRVLSRRLTPLQPVD